jgi:uncharacterized protein YbjT (DUF2867 family)
MSRTVLLAGATGVVGSAVLDRLVAAGHRVRTLSRDPARAEALRARGAWEVRAADATRADALTGVAEGCDVVVSCLGGNVGMGFAERRSYRAVDTAGNRNLLAAAKTAGVERFVYTAVHVGPGYVHTRYIRAHEEFIEELRGAGLSSTVVRPTGIFTAFAPFVGMARRGLVSIIGDGKSRSNPVHHEDVADAIVPVLDEGPADLSIGGPDVLTRREMAELAFRAVGRSPRVWGVPVVLPKLSSFFLRLVHPRLGELIQFAAAVFTSDCVAPTVGKRRLADYFATLG